MKTFVSTVSSEIYTSGQYMDVEGSVSTPLYTYAYYLQFCFLCTKVLFILSNQFIVCTNSIVCKRCFMSRKSDVWLMVGTIMPGKLFYLNWACVPSIQVNNPLLGAFFFRCYVFFILLAMSHSFQTPDIICLSFSLFHLFVLL